MTDAETLNAVLAYGPMLRSNAVIVLCGEDATPRMQVAVGIMLEGGADTVVLSGGLHDPPRWIGAKQMRPKLMGQGVAPSKIMVEGESTNTREQATALVEMIAEQSWRRVLLVASAYHITRAFLTLLQALKEQGFDESVQVIPVAATHAPWWEAPEGMDVDRLTLLAGEAAKIQRYGEMGHVAGYHEGIEYLKRWEGV